MKPLAMMTVDRSKLSELLHELGVFLDLLGENPFKVRAFENGARVIDNFEGDLNEVIKSGKLTDIKGIGKGLSEKILEFAKTGKIKEYDELKAKIPPGLLEMLKISGLGPKRVKIISEKLDVFTVGELEYACRENRLKILEGFGEKSQANILKGIEFLKKFQNTFLYSDARLEADILIAQLSKLKSIESIEVGGSLRRKKEIVRDIDILVATKKPAEVSKKFITIPGVERVLAEGETKSSIILKSGMQVDLRVVTGEEFPYALLYFTGSKEHNTALRGLAKSKGLKLNEYGLFKGEKLVKCDGEAEIYKALGLDFIAPELRENMGELAAAEKGKLPNLVVRDQIRGFFHCHTTDSDGMNSVEEMVERSEALGFEYIGISDHSVSSTIANGMKKSIVNDQFKRIEALQKRKKIKILKGVEADILSDGALDFDDGLLSRFDFVIGSIHLGLQMPEAKMTARVLKALKNKNLDFLGHPTGRLLLARDGIEVDMHTIIREATKLGVVVELNANPQRLDVDWRLGKFIIKVGARVSINPDAHSVPGIDDIDYGIGIARKAWLGTEQILNTLPYEKMIKTLRRNL